MLTARKIRTVSTGKFILLRFIREYESVLTDNHIETAILFEHLRPVTANEFKLYLRDVLGSIPPQIRIALYGNIVHGPSTQGSLPGIPYLDTTGIVQIIENWTRGSTCDQWNDDWEFLFVSV